MTNPHSLADFIIKIIDVNSFIINLLENDADIELDGVYRRTKN